MTRPPKKTLADRHSSGKPDGPRNRIRRKRDLTDQEKADARRAVLQAFGHSGKSVTPLDSGPVPGWRSDAQLAAQLTALLDQAEAIAAPDLTFSQKTLEARKRAFHGAKAKEARQLRGNALELRAWLNGKGNMPPIYYALLAADLAAILAVRGHFFAAGKAAAGRPAIDDDVTLDLCEDIKDQHPERDNAAVIREALELQGQPADRKAVSRVDGKWRNRRAGNT